MKIALPRDSEGPEFGKVVKRLRDANGLPIGTANDNLILDTPKLMMRAIDSSYLTQLLTTELIALKSNLMMFYHKCQWWKMSSSNYQRMGNSHSMERWLHHLGEAQRCQRGIPSSTG